MQVSDRIGRRLKLHDLHALMAVVQAGSMGRPRDCSTRRSRRSRARSPT